MTKISIPIGAGGTVEIYTRKDGGVDLYAGRTLGPPCHDDVVHPTGIELGDIRDAIVEIIEDQERAADIAEGEAAGLRKGAKQRAVLEQRIQELELALKPFAVFQPYASLCALHGKQKTRVTPLDFERAKQALEKGRPR